MSRVPVKPSFALVRSPVWEQTEEDVRGGFAELAETLGKGIETFELPDPFKFAHDWHRAIMYADLARHFARYYDQAPDALSERLIKMIEEGLQVRAIDYNRAVDGMAALNSGLEKLFERFDAIVTPAAPGEAPQGLESTGNPAFATIWTYCGVPAVTLPLLTGSNNMPIGVQLVGRKFYDGRLLRTARWLTGALLSEGQDTQSVRGGAA
jgi:Asp-tRNA(Asn)/Glu-tRNA(Gln) amidotransferase A subunit family amidase